MDEPISEKQFFNIEVRTVPLPLTAVHQSMAGTSPKDALERFKKYLQDNSQSAQDFESYSPLGVSLKAMEGDRISDFIVKNKDGEILYKERVNPNL